MCINNSILVQVKLSLPVLNIAKSSKTLSYTGSHQYLPMNLKGRGVVSWVGGNSFFIVFISFMYN